MRPMWLDYPDDPKTFDLEYQYLFGENMLVSLVEPSYTEF